MANDLDHLEESIEGKQKGTDITNLFLNVDLLYTLYSLAGGILLLTFPVFSRYA